MSGRISYFGGIAQGGLILAMDAAKNDSYPKTGTIWRNVSGSVTGGTLTNGPSFNSDVGGNILFDGSNDFVQLGNVLSFERTNTFTISAWFKSTFTGATPNSIFCKNRLVNSPADYTGYQFGLNIQTATTGDAGKIGFVLVSSPFLGTSSVIRRQLTVKYNTGTWTNATVTYNGSSQRSGIVLYANGLTGSTNDDGSTSISNTTITAANCQIGARDGTEQPFNGSIAYVLVYNRVLNASEVVQNYNALKGRFGL